MGFVFILSAASGVPGGVRGGEGVVVVVVAVTMQCGGECGDCSGWKGCGGDYRWCVCEVGRCWGMCMYGVRCDVPYRKEEEEKEIKVKK